MEVPVERPERLVEAVAILLTRNTAFSYHLFLSEAVSRD
jgi:hypothetical protein